MLRHRWLFHREIALGIFFVACAMGGGCASPRKQPVATTPPTTRPVVSGRPMLDIGRGGAGLPLEDSVVFHTREELQNTIEHAFARRMILQNSTTPVTVVGDDLRDLDLLKIELSNGVIREEFRPSQNKEPGHAEPAISAKRFEYRAWPVYYQKFATSWRVSATDARFGLIRDSAGHQTLVLTDAREGSFDFSVRLEDIKQPRVLTKGPTTSESGVGVKDVELQFTSENPQNLIMQVQMKTVMLLVPITFRVHARLDVDAWCNVRLSELSCEGLDPGGKVLAAFVDGAIQKYNGQTMPLVRWPEDRMVLTDVRFHLDDSLTISANFASREYADGGR